MKRSAFRLVVAAGLVTGLGVPAIVLATGKGEDGKASSPDRVSSLVQRSVPSGDDAPVTNGIDAQALDSRKRTEKDRLMQPARFPQEFRTITGVGNNPMNPTAGAAGTPFIRYTERAYEDGVSAPAGADRPSARAVSNVIHAQLEPTPSEDGLSDLVWQWGQFLDHDFTETPVASPVERFDIVVPAGDAWFDPFNTGTASIPLDRSGWAVVDGKREQINLITAFIDASNVYGSDDVRAAFLRTSDGTGRLKVSENDFLPLNTAQLPNAMGNDPDRFIAGDARASEQIALAAMHTLWVREHNYWADRIRALAPNMSGEQIYQRARAIVAAEMQVITYNEFLPAILGPDPLPPYEGYNPNVDPTIAAEFSTAAFRIGHTMLAPEIRLVDSDFNPVAGGSIALRDMFFDDDTFRAIGMEPILLGMATQRQQIIDQFVVDDVRNFLFGPPGAGGFDLVSLNVQRGRDHGIGSYNDIREAMGLPRAQTFLDINPDPNVAIKFASVYADIEQVDAWPGLLAEPPVAGGLVGETMRAVLVDQFTRLRDGDRFWYQSYLPPGLSSFVERQSLARVIRRNTEIGDELQNDAFRVPDVVDTCPADFTGDGVIDIFDFLLFSGAYSLGNPAADLNGDGVVNRRDLRAFLVAFLTGC